MSISISRRKSTCQFLLTWENPKVFLFFWHQKFCDILMWWNCTTMFALSWEDSQNVHLQKLRPQKLTFFIWRLSINGTGDIFGFFWGHKTRGTSFVGFFCIYIFCLRMAKKPAAKLSPGKGHKWLTKYFALHLRSLLSHILAWAHHQCLRILFWKRSFFTFGPLLPRVFHPHRGVSHTFVSDKRHLR